MGTAELRKYNREFGNREDYVVEDTIQISENGIDHLETPPESEDGTEYYQWVYLGTRAEQLASTLGSELYNY